MELTIKELKPFLFGLPWFGKEDYELQRFPTSALPKMGEDLQIVSKHPSGAVIRFRAKSEIVALDFKITENEDYFCFSKSGQSGIDIYCDGTFVGHIETKPGYQTQWLKTDITQFHDYEIFLPIYAQLELMAVIIEGEYEGVGDDGPEFEKPADFSVKGKIVVYGSSITQGAFSSRPALTYPTRLGRELNAEIVNLGCAGTGKGEHVVSDLLAEIEDVSLFILDWGCNISDPKEVMEIKERYPYMLEQLEAKHPNTPILFISPQTFISESQDPMKAKSFKVIRKTVEENYRQTLKSGTKCDFIDGREIIGPGDLDCTVDGIHCNDLGFDRYVKKILPFVQNLLNLKK